MIISKLLNIWEKIALYQCLLFSLPSVSPSPILIYRGNENHSTYHTDFKGVLISDAVKFQHGTWAVISTQWTRAIHNIHHTSDLWWLRELRFREFKSFARSHLRVAELGVGPQLAWVFAPCLLDTFSDVSLTKPAMIHRMCLGIATCQPSTCINSFKLHGNHNKKTLKGTGTAARGQGHVAETRQSWESKLAALSPEPTAHSPRNYRKVTVW